MAETASPADGDPHQRTALDLAVKVAGILCAIPGAVAAIIPFLALLAITPLGQQLLPVRNPHFLGSMRLLLPFILLHGAGFIVWLILDALRAQRAVPERSMARLIGWAVLCFVPGVHIWAGWRVFARNAADAAPDARIAARWRLLRRIWLVCAIIAFACAVLALIMSGMNGPPLPILVAYALAFFPAVGLASYLIWRFSAHPIINHDATTTRSAT